MAQNYNRLKLACYTSNLSMSIVGNLSPLLFLTFRSLYGISYSLLGLLVLINFFTQLIIDLILPPAKSRFGRGGCEMRVDGRTVFKINLMFAIVDA